MSLKVLILGYGEMGHAMEFLLKNKHAVHIWSQFSPLDLKKEVMWSEVILFCLPASAHVEVVQKIIPYIQHNPLCLSIAKGLDEAGMSAAQVFHTLLPEAQRYGVLYGPMISEEIRLDRLAFADVALSRPEDFERIRSLFGGSKLSCKYVADMAASSWFVILKNVYAIIFGIADQLELGDNMRGHLMVAALFELSGIVNTLTGKNHTPYGYAGLGDLLTTATSTGSHHYALGRKLAAGDYSDITGEGIHTLLMVEKFHLFDHTPYPLYTLISNIVNNPESLKLKLEKYIEQLSSW